MFRVYDHSRSLSAHLALINPEKFTMIDFVKYPGIVIH